MYHSGVGGGGFMLVRSSNGSYEFIDFRETAPNAAFEDMYEGNVEGSLRGGLSRFAMPLRSVARWLRLKSIVEFQENYAA